VRVTWTVKGTPTLLVRLADPRLGVVDADEELVTAPDTIEFTLVVAKGGKEAVQHLDVLQYADSTLTDVVFPTSLVGDMLVASGEKNPARWQETFVVQTVASGSGRMLEVRHGTRSVELDASGVPSDALAGLPVQGHWEIRSRLSGAERTTPGARPDRLRVGVVLICQRSQP
jgi:hypothetical protein